jgi:hypothetical protein
MRGRRSSRQSRRGQDCYQVADTPGPLPARITSTSVGALPTAAEHDAVLTRSVPGRERAAPWPTRLDAGRCFRLVLSGRCDVTVDDRLVSTLGPDDHLGQLAARDWGGGYGYARLPALRCARVRSASRTG